MKKINKLYVTLFLSFMFVWVIGLIFMACRQDALWSVGYLMTTIPFIIWWVDKYGDRV